MDNSRPGQALAATLEEPGFYAGDPFPHYARLRREAPLAWNAQLGYWAVSKHADVVAISARSRDVLLGQGNPHLRDRRRVPDPAHDDAHRSARPHALPQARATGLRAVAHACARRSGCGPAPTSSSRASSPARRSTRSRRWRCPFPLWIIAELLGIPESDWPRFYQWSEASIPGATDWPPEECAASAGRDARVPARARRGRAAATRATTSSRCSPTPRSTASRSATTSS